MLIFSCILWEIGSEHTEANNHGLFKVWLYMNLLYGSMLHCILFPFQPMSYSMLMYK